MGTKLRARVALTPEEVYQTVWAAVCRTVQASVDDRGTRYGHPSNRWQADIVGALGEMVVAKWLGLPFDFQIGRTDRSDVGPFEVRSTNYPDGKLLLHEGERGPYILVNPTRSVLEYCVCGWINADDSQVVQYRERSMERHGTKVYAVPEHALRDPFELQIWEKVT